MSIKVWGRCDANSFHSYLVRQLKILTLNLHAQSLKSIHFKSTRKRMNTHPPPRKKNKKGGLPQSPQYSSNTDKGCWLDYSKLKYII